MFTLNNNYKIFVGKNEERKWGDIQSLQNNNKLVFLVTLAI